MQEIKITFQSPGLPEAINNLAQSIGGKTAQSVMYQSAQAVANVPSPVNDSPMLNVDPSVQNASSTPVSPDPVPAQTVTIDAISRAGAAMCDQGKMGQLVALLNKYGVQTVMQLKDKPSDTLNAFTAELRALGAVI